MVTKKITLNELRSLVKQIIKEETELNYIVVLPYDETSRLFHASKTKKEEAFIGDDKTVYYQSQAKKFSKEDAEKKVKESKNKEAHIRKV